MERVVHIGQNEVKSGQRHQHVQNLSVRRNTAHLETAVKPDTRVKFSNTCLCPVGYL